MMKLNRQAVEIGQRAQARNERAEKRGQSARDGCWHGSPPGITRHLALASKSSNCQ
ncbi:hypothetical protein RZS08_19185 [Arthrospira platensis SPKY1]|nr:hypothetical protein [Arthrospira platensis SPKY1]